MTQDIDIVIDNGAVKERLVSFIESLHDSSFLFDAKAVLTAVDQKQMFRLLVSIDTLKLDIYPRELIPGDGPSSNDSSHASS